MCHTLICSDHSFLIWSTSMEESVADLIAWFEKEEELNPCYEYLKRNYDAGKKETEEALKIFCADHKSKIFFIH
jgi:hypothetical protein